MLKFFIAFLPSAAKIAVYRALGAKIGIGCRIGFNVLEADTLVIGDHVHIGHFNLLWRIKELRLDTGSRINNFNWITGARTGSFRLGRNSAITRLHFFEASASMEIGANCIIAGRNSHFFTHGISARNLDDMRPIHIADWCYIGSSSRFVPGAGVGRGTFVGMGSVVTKAFGDEFVLIAGNPAQVRKKLASSDAYFARHYLPHSHHPTDYAG